MPNQLSRRDDAEKLQPDRAADATPEEMSWTEEDEQAEAEDFRDAWDSERRQRRELQQERREEKNLNG